jgi:hypothetical protein
LKILFDQGTPAPLRHELPGHEVTTAHEAGWAELSNGALLAEAEKVFEAFVTTDQNLAYQQNLAGRRLAILVLCTTSWPRIKRHVSLVRAAIEQLGEGAYVELTLPE